MRLPVTSFAIVLLLCVGSRSTTMSAEADCVGFYGQTRNCSITHTEADGSYSAIDGDLVLVSDRDAGVYLYDVSDPDHPDSVGVFECSLAGAVDLEGGLAVVSGFEGLCFFDVHDPAAPEVMGTLAGLNCVDIEIQDHIAYGVCWDEQLVAIDLTDPTDPTLAGSIDLGGDVRGIDVEGTLACVYGLSAGLLLIDIGDPTDPRLIGSFIDDEELFEVALDGDVAIAFNTARELLTIDVSRPSMPVLLDRLPLDVRGGDIACDDGYVYVLGSLINVVDITNPSDIATVDYLRSLVAARDVFLSGDTLLMVGRNMFSIARTGNHARQDPVGTAPLPDYFRTLTACGNHAVLTVGDSLLVVDSTEPMEPAAGEILRFPGWIDAIAAHGSKVWAICGDTLLCSIDLSNPSAPSVVVEYSAPETWFFDLVAGDGYVVTKGWRSGFTDYQISIFTDRESLEIADSFEIDYADVMEMKVWGNFLAVAGPIAYDDYEIRIFDLSDPAAPVLWSRVDYEKRMSDFTLVDGYLYVTRYSIYPYDDYEAGVDVFDLTDPGNPYPCAELPLLIANASSVEAGGGMLYLHGWGTVGLVDITDPYSPQSVGQWGHVPYTHFALADDYMVMVAAYGGEPTEYELCLVPRACEESPRTDPRYVLPTSSAGVLHAASPNPFNPATDIAYTLLRSGHTTVGVYDLAGHCVALLDDGDRTAGTYTTSWNGTDGGRPMPSGIYLVRLQVDGETASSRKVTLLR